MTSDGLWHIVGPISGISGTILAVWTAYYFNLFRKIDVEAIRSDFIDRIQSENPQMGAKDLIDLIYEEDFRILMKGEKGIGLYVSAIALVCINLILIIFSVLNYVNFLSNVIEPVFSLFLVLYIISLVFFAVFLHGQILYYVKFDRHRITLSRP